MLILEEREAGASMVMMDMRYMWSEMDSPDVMLKRRQPSRLVVLRRSRRCRKGRGVPGWDVGGGDGRAARAKACEYWFERMLSCRVGARCRM